MTPSTRCAFFTFAGTLHFAARASSKRSCRRRSPRARRRSSRSAASPRSPAASRSSTPPPAALGRWWLLALLLAVFPANIHMAVNPEQIRGLDLRKFPRWALWARLPLQPLAMLWVWRATRD